MRVLVVEDEAITGQAAFFRASSRATLWTMRPTVNALIFSDTMDLTTPLCSIWGYRKWMA